MKRTVFLAMVLALVFAMDPGARACSGSEAEANLQTTDAQVDEKLAASDAGLAVLLGLMLGTILTEPTAASTLCPHCTETR